MIENTGPNKNISYSATSGGLGVVARVGAGFSWITNDFINGGIDFDYLSTSISRRRDFSFYQVNKSGDIDYRFTGPYNITCSVKLLTISPNITVKSISRPRFFIFNKMGPVLTFCPNSVHPEKKDPKIRMAWQGLVKNSSRTIQRSSCFSITKIYNYESTSTHKELYR